MSKCCKPHILNSLTWSLRVSFAYMFTVYIIAQMMSPPPQMDHQFEQAARSLGSRRLVQLVQW